MISCFTPSSSSSTSEVATHKLVTYLHTLTSSSDGDHTGKLRVIVSTLHRLTTTSSSMTDDTVISVMAGNRSSPILLSLLTKLVKQDKSLQQLMRASANSITNSISGETVPLLFLAAVRACLKQLGDEVPVEGGGRAAMMTRLKKMKIEEMVVPCNELVRGGSVMVEEVLVRVTRRAVMEGKEKEGLQLLTAFTDSLPPSSHSSTHSHSNDIHEMDLSPSDPAHPITVHGLTCDLMELLDPNILQLCPSEGRKIIVGTGGGRGEVVGGKVVVSPQQSYLLGRVVHQSSWVVLRDTIANLLDPHCCQEW